MTADARPAPDGLPSGGRWVAVCRLDDLPRERGVAALVAGGQGAVFRLVDDTGRAGQHQDPYSGAHGLARGIVGTRGGAPTIASPMHKQVFDLRTGECLDPVGSDPRRLRTWRVLVVDDVVLVAGVSGGDVDSGGPEPSARDLPAVSDLRDTPGSAPDFADQHATVVP
ncbi:nitrite reductase small subunit NirD [Cellulomonas timonensis]|uniref:nitrite reductase small subunit NirD n=1 Tax=Cellulomonas timonensis TaxID=1689271 RepID=UPI0009EEC2D1|nr:nitrite reductase small subunit NirD [Cellulomonas timonensis]